MLKRTALAVSLVAGALLIGGPASSAPIGAAGKQVTNAAVAEGLVEEVGRRKWRKHRHFGRRHFKHRRHWGHRFHHRRHWRKRHRHRHFYPYFYGGYPYYYYPYYRHRGFSIHLHF